MYNLKSILSVFKHNYNIMYIQEVYKGVLAGFPFIRRANDSTFKICNYSNTDSTKLRFFFQSHLFLIFLESLE